MDKYKKFSVTGNIGADSSKGAKVVAALTYGLYLSASIALTVATGIYLWDKETDNQCWGHNDSGDNAII